METKIKILVTGGTGLLGTKLLDEIDKDKYEVTIVRRLGSDKSFLYDDRVAFIELDITKPIPKEKITTDYSIIIHAASVFTYDKTNFHVNVETTKNILEWGIKVNIYQFIFISSCGVMGDVYSGLRDESFVELPDNNYARSKLESERLVQEYSKKNDFSYTIIRPGLIYGLNDRGTGLINLIKYLDRKVVIVPCSGLNKKSLVSNVFLSECIISSISNKEAYNEIFISVDSEAFSVRRIIEEIVKRFHTRVYVLYLPDIISKVIASMINMVENNFFNLGKAAYDIRKFRSNNIYSSKKIIEKLDLSESNLLLDELDSIVKDYRVRKSCPPDSR